MKWNECNYGFYESPMTTRGGAKSTGSSPPLTPNRDETELASKGQRKTGNMSPVKNNMQLTRDKRADKRQ